MRYERPNLELANNGVIVTCDAYGNDKEGDPYSSGYKHEKFVFGFDQMDEAVEKLKEFGKLAGYNIQDSKSTEEDD